MKPIFLIALVSVALSVARTLLGGQDLNFDLQTYHYYLGYSAFTDRFDKDFLAASFQGYQSPVPYMLLYWLDSIGTAPFVNASIHAAIHAVNLILLFLIARSLVSDRVLVLALWLLGAIAPAYWHLVGTSYADLLASVPLLAGLWLVARGHVAAGAALAGVAMGLRVHNAIYLVGLFCALAATRQDRLRSLAVFGSAAFAGWLLCFAPWALRLYREFGSPLFPFYNGVFRSADFPAANIPLFSFVPDSLAALVTLPFRMASYTYWVYVEGRVPDVRPALLVISLAALALLWLFRRPRVALEIPFIVVFFAVSAALWLASSSNGRYGITLFLLGGPVCGYVLSRLLPLRYVVLVVAAVVAWQALLQVMLFRESRTVSTPWASRYFDWTLADRHQREPATFLSFALQSGSTLAPRVHPASSHVNLVGQYTPSIDGPGSERIRRIIALDRQRYGVFDAEYTESSAPGAKSIKTYFGGHLALWALEFTEEPCEPVSLRAGTETRGWVRWFSGLTIHAVPASFLVCKLRPIAPEQHARFVEEFKTVRQKVERLGAACPQHFGKPLSYTRVYQRWTVTPLHAIEWRLDVQDDGAMSLHQLTPPYAVLELGAEPDCRTWFSKLAELSAQRRLE